MRSTFLQVLVIFLSSEGYRLQFCIPRAYFVYTVWHCTGQHCSSMYACTYRLFTGTWRPQWVLLQHSIVLRRVFFIVECGIARFLCAIRALSSPLGYLGAKFRFFRGLHCWASPWRMIAYSINQSITQSLTHLTWCPVNRSLRFGIVFLFHIYHATVFCDWWL